MSDERVDIILMSSTTYALFAKEMECSPIPEDELAKFLCDGFMKTYRFCGALCLAADLKKEEVRFVSQGHCVTRDFNPSQSGIFAFLSLHINAMNAGLQEL